MAERVTREGERTENDDSRPAARLLADGGELPNTVVVESVGADATSSYEFGVSGDLTQVGGTVDGREVSNNWDDGVANGVASGAVYGGADGFRYAGSIEWFWTSDPDQVEVFVDGERTDPSSIGASDDRAPTARIDLPARTVVEETPVELRGDESSEAAGPIVSYEWTVEHVETLETRSAWGEVASVTLPETGPWRVRLTVEDDDSATDQAVERITVENEIEPLDS